MQKINGYSAAMRAIAGLSGGFLGTVIVAGVALLASQLLSSVFSEGEQSLFFTVLFILTFLISSILSTLLTFFIMHKTESDTFFYFGPALSKAMILNLGIFILLLPAYFIGGSFNSFFVLVTGAVHFLFSTVFSYLVFDIEARSDKNPLFSVFASLTGGLLGTVLVMLFFSFAGQGQVLAFIVPLVPLIMWTLICGFSSVLEILYSSIYSSMGIDIFQSSGYDRQNYSEEVARNERIARELEEQSRYMQ